MTSPAFQSEYETIKTFLEEKPASQKAVQCLKLGTEIGLRINNSELFTYLNLNNEPNVNPLPPKNHDVEFDISSVAVNKLKTLPATDMGDFGIEVVKMVLLGEIKIKVVGSMFAMVKNGYLKIIKEAGPSFLSFLGKNGVNSLAKIPQIFKNLRS